MTLSPACLVLFAGLAALAGCATTPEATPTSAPASAPAQPTKTVTPPPVPLLLDDQIVVSQELPDVEVGINNLAGTNLQAERFGDGYEFTAGTGMVARTTGGRVARALRVRGVHEPEGMRVIQVNVSPDRVVTIADVRSPLLEDRPIITDDELEQHHAIGFFHRTRGVDTLHLDPANGVTVNDLPVPAAEDALILIFRTPSGTNLEWLRVGDQAIARIDVFVPYK